MTRADYEAERDEITFEDVRDEILYLMQRSGYLVELTDDGSLYFPEAATICEFTNA
jgi:hypothetical protein